jgi:hypothetical protein
MAAATTIIDLDTHRASDTDTELETLLGKLKDKGELLDWLRQRVQNGSGFATSSISGSLTSEGQTPRKHAPWIDCPPSAPANSARLGASRIARA